MPIPDYATLSVALYFLLLIAIGVYAMKTSTADNSEYLLGGRKVSAKVTALSAGASDMSGWMLMGLPGAAYVSGLDSIWLALGLVVGAYVNYQLVAPKLRVFTEVADDALTIPEFFSKRFAKENARVRLVSSLVIILFFTVYTASGLVAGGKLFQSAFAMDYQVGVIITVGVVVLYTMLGGFLAVSVSDFVQGIIMLIALIAVPVFTLQQLDMQTTWNDSQILAGLDWSTVQWVTAFSLFTWGLGYFGQPHIIVRFMAINTHHNIPKAKNIGISWMTISIIGALLTGIIGAKFIAQSSQSLNDPETIFIFLSQFLFHPFVAGWFLAAILAAIMSTISSQLLVSSSSLVEDVYKHYTRKPPEDKELLFVSRACVLVVAVIASLIAMDATSSVLSLVSNAWAGFGAAFGPLVLLSLWWKRLTHAGALTGIVVGATTVLLWANVPVLDGGETLSSLFYELLPGFILSLVATIWVSLKTAEPKQQALDWLQETEQLVQSDNQH
ncbi:sodium/proline symporter PutP [Thalassotalea mangrovi]|uniref:Sodium/proline symporter n=1 Tax=Thalassotalea mangrovi TaxID=2572245 RepID=A0A4U1BAX3_9GAMM|nr:sodium/proline symporter PutP [Thalassotalea mangrovi]TKB47708.1 sodium/proline symporter PutP [Thalassotalea mangrovi]